MKDCRGLMNDGLHLCIYFGGYDDGWSFASSAVKVIILVINLSENLFFNVLEDLSIVMARLTARY